ncbi:MAG: type II toxin-antitoxin system RelE/ParE family toxin [Kofleriaceae bacterium]
MKVAFRHTAIDDLEHTYRWLRAQNDQAAERFLAAAQEEIALLSGHPFLGRRRHFQTRGFRSWRIRGFEKHIIYYRVTTRVLEIVRVLHGAREIRDQL